MNILIPLGLLSLIFWMKFFNWLIYFGAGKWGKYRVCAQCYRWATSFEYIDHICEKCGADMPKNLETARARWALRGFRFEVKRSSK